MTRIHGQVQDLLAGTAPRRVRGATWRAGGRGELRVGGSLAEVRIEGDRLRATLALPEAVHARDLLVRSAAWPANLRAAARAGGVVLLADGWLEDERAAALSLREIRRGLAEACGAALSSASGHTRAFDPAGLIGALHEKGERLVALEGGFELFPQVHGVPVPVRATVNGRGLLFSRPLVRMQLERELDAPHERTLAHIALRLNARLRFARLVERVGRMHAEARLAARLADLGRVLASARAVAFADEDARTYLEVFAHDSRAAHAYARVFLSETSHQGVPR